MTTKNFKNLGANPVQVTQTPGEFNNTLSTDIPRQTLPYNYYLGSIETGASLPAAAGDLIPFENTIQSSEQNLIQVTQVPAAGAVPAYTSFKLKGGHIYSLKAQVFETTTAALDSFGWFKKEDVIPTFNAGNIIGRKGQQIQLQTFGYYLTPAVGFFDASNIATDTELVVSFIIGSGSNKQLSNSYVEIFNITDKTGPWV